MIKQTIQLLHITIFFSSFLIFCEEPNQHHPTSENSSKCMKLYKQLQESGIELPSELQNLSEQSCTETAHSDLLKVESPEEPISKTRISIEASEDPNDILFLLFIMFFKKFYLNRLKITDQKDSEENQMV
jgi:hypothetical protein